MWRWSECGRLPPQDPPLQVAFAAQDNVLVFQQSGRVSDPLVGVVHSPLAHPSTAPGAACLSPNGLMLTDRTETSWRFWYAGQSSASRELPLPAEPCGPRLGYTADGRHLLAFGEGSACVVDAQTGDVAARVAAPATSLGWHDGKLIMPFGNQGVTSFDADGQSVVTLLEPLGLPRQEPSAADEPFDSTVISPAGDRVAVHSRGYGFGLYDAQTGALLVAYPIDTAHSFRPVFSLNGVYLLLGDRVLRAADGEVVFEPPGLPSGFEAAALANNGKKLALMRKTADGREGTVLHVDSKSGRSMLIAGGHNKPVLSVAVSPDGTQLVTTTGETLLGWSNVAGFKVAWSADAGLELNARYSADGSLIAVSSDKPQVLSADGATVFRPEIAPITSGCKSVQTLAFSPDGRWVARSGLGTTDIFEQGTWNHVTQLESKGCFVSAAFSPDSRYLMTSIPELFETDGWTQVWDTDVVVDGAPNAYDVAFLPHGREFISSACAFGRNEAPYTLCFDRLFSVGGRLVERLNGLGSWPSFAADGDWIIAANTAMYRRTWRPEVFFATPNVTASTFTPDGDIIAGTQDGSLLRLCRSP